VNGWTPAAKPGKPTITAPHTTPRPTAEHTPDKHKALKFSKGETALAVFAIVAATSVSGLGLYSSFAAVQKKAGTPVSLGGWGFEDPWMLPIGIDLSILAFSLINLLLIRADRPAAWVKWVPRVGAAGTIYLNWQSAASLPAQIGHAVLAGLWVVFSEIGAHLYASHIGEAKGRVRMDRIRLSRWILQPVSTARIAHYMKSYEEPSYTEALRRDQEWRVYRAMLRQVYGRRWRFKAPSDKLAPLQLASHGLSLDAALEVPDLQEEKALLRVQASDLRKAEAGVQRIEAESKLNAKKLEAKTLEVEAEGRLKVATAKAETAASIEVQKAEADLQVHRAEAQATIQQVTDQAEARSREIAEQEERRRTAAAREKEKDQFNWDLEQKRLTRQQQIETDALALEDDLKETAEAARLRLEAEQANRHAAQVAKDAADLRARAAEDAKKEAEALRKADEARLKAAEAEEARAAAEHRAANELKAAATARLQAAETDRLAAAAEAEARLTPVERQARDLADMLRHEPHLTLEEIANRLGVSVATASGRRKRAQQILDDQLQNA
jgi:DNA-binding CsgD family transcriptional regulator